MTCVSAIWARMVACRPTYPAIRAHVVVSPAWAEGSGYGVPIGTTLEPPSDSKIHGLSCTSRIQRPLTPLEI